MRRWRRTGYMYDFLEIIDTSEIQDRIQQDGDHTRRMRPGAVKIQLRSRGLTPCNALANPAEDEWAILAGWLGGIRFIKLGSTWPRAAAAGCKMAEQGKTRLIMLEREAG